MRRSPVQLHKAWGAVWGVGRWVAKCKRSAGGKALTSAQEEVLRKTAEGWKHYYGTLTAESLHTTIEREQAEGAGANRAQEVLAEAEAKWRERRCRWRGDAAQWRVKEGIERRKQGGGVTEDDEAELRTNCALMLQCAWRQLKARQHAERIRLEQERETREGSIDVPSLEQTAAWLAPYLRQKAEEPGYMIVLKAVGASDGEDDGEWAGRMRAMKNLIQKGREEHSTEIKELKQQMEEQMEEQNAKSEQQNADLKQQLREQAQQLAAILAAVAR
jgi:hypothetical protein